MSQQYFHCLEQVGVLLLLLSKSIGEPAGCESASLPADRQRPGMSLSSLCGSSSKYSTDIQYNSNYMFYPAVESRKLMVNV